MPPEVPLYDALAADYDRFVDWQARLAHEMPFFDDLFAGRGVRRVLDAACGTGHHALALARRGYQVAGADLSAAMVERARANAATAGLEVNFAVAGLGDLHSLGQTFDAVICLGNSLPHLLTDEEMAQALADFAAVLRPGGLLVVQNRNFDRVWARQERFMGPQSHRQGDEEWLFVRFYDYGAETLTFNMVRLRRNGETWRQDVQSTELRPIFHRQLAADLAAAGFGRVDLYGGYDAAPFDAEESGDLLAVAA
ncbi:MAG: class I SAM-dependent methyltransferase, partial [Anaerolineae bacterium]